MGRRWVGQGTWGAASILVAGALGVGCERADDAAGQPTEEGIEEGPDEGIEEGPDEVKSVQGEVRRPRAEDEDSAEGRARRGLEDLRRATEDLARQARDVAEDAGRRAEEVGRDVDTETSKAAGRLAESLDQAARAVRGEARGEETSRRAAVEATAVRLRDCDLSRPFYFFFEPGSAALRGTEGNRARQLNHCLQRAESDEGLVVIGYSELGSDDQSSVSLALSRAHNVAQQVAMDGVVAGTVVVQASPPAQLPRKQEDFGRRVEVWVRR